MAGDDTTSTSTPLKPITPIAQYQCPKLKTTNYTVWAIQIKVILEAYDLREAIEPKEYTQVDDKKDKATTAFLYQALTEDVILQVAGCETAMERKQEPITDSPITPPAYTYNLNLEEEKEATISSPRNSDYRFDDTPKREEPRNYKEASKDEKWIEAMEDWIGFNQQEQTHWTLIHCNESKGNRDSNGV
ncbi:hypothetical protein Tco_0726769 [Tanacetum coccineum]|uniref:Zinc finger, CCHC-type n=1 Tax=Tanacetum coccineum TaxID=301880 RepID=A0ABQ4YGH7_9ASTR